MKYEKIQLKDIVNGPIGDSSFLEIYKSDETDEIRNAPHPVIVVLPGGAYQFCSRREAEPVALRFVSEGFVVFVLSYTCNVAFPIPHNETALVFDYVNKHADEYLVDRNRISIMGFSAGAHLAASYSLIHKELADNLCLEDEKIKPYADILGYPVTSLILDTQSETRNIITGGSEELRQKLTVPENMVGDFPPTFLWATKTDLCVPPEHSLIMYEALKRNNVLCQLEMYETGIHGGSLVNRGVYAPDFDFKSTLENRNWVTKAVEFIYNLK